MRLLIVKGNLDIAAVIERDITIAFRGESLRLFSVPTLESGISALSVFEPHLILFDAALPDGEGFALIDRVRDTSIVTVCLSDRVTETLVSNVAQYGVFRVLLEPWRAAELSAVVGEALLEARQRRQYQLRQYQLIEQQTAVGHDAAARAPETQGEEELRVIFTDALGRSVSARADAILFCEAQKTMFLFTKKTPKQQFSV